MKRTYTVVFISILIGIITILSVSYINIVSNDKVKSKNGILVIENVDLKKKGSAKLTGEWEFYPNKLITPKSKENVFEQYHDIKKIIKVPGTWDKHISDDNSPIGFGTYRLTIQVPRDDLYGVKINTIRHASKTFINGNEVGSSGVPSEDITNHKTNSDFYMGFGMSENKLVELVIHVSNYYYPTGGIIQATDFGLFNQVIHERETKILLESLIASGYIILGFYFLGSFFQWRKLVYLLYFSLFCIAQSIYVSTLNERLINIVFLDVNFQTLTRIQMVLIHFVILFFLMFIHAFLNNYTNRRIVKILKYSLLIEGFLLGFKPTDSFIEKNISIYTTQIIIVIILAASYGYILYTLFKVLRNKTVESGYILIIATTFIYYGLLLGVNFLFEIEIGNIPILLLLVMTFGLGLLISHRLQDSYNQIDKLSQKLKINDELKDQFLAKTSHELRTPLHIINSLSQLLLEGREGLLNLKQQKSVMVINNKGKALTNIVEDLLDASKLRHGVTEISPSMVDIRIINEIIYEIRYLIPEEKNIDIKSEISEEILLIYVDVNRFRQIMSNLIHNAIKFTKYGEIRVLVKLYDKKVYISIIDTGVGIEENELQYIFTSFYQGKNYRKNIPQGLGLGLGIVKKLVELHGGDIWVNSERGKGTEFTFTLPVVSDTSIDTNEGKDIESQINDRKYTEEKHDSMSMTLPKKIHGTVEKTILVVDDEHSNLKILMDTVNCLKYTVIAADSGESALQVLKNEKIDMVILDLMMPDMSGYDVCKVIRRHYHMVELPILILTASGRLRDMIDSFNIGANDFIQKPICLEELKAHIESLMCMKLLAQNAIKHELNYLQAQIKPHFLYNTLNTIIGLSYRDEEKTREALHNLATYFRAKLDFYNHNDFISLEKEIELLKAYLSIEQMRYGEKLKVEYDIDESIDILLPSLTIQPIVENAVRHGIAKKSSNGTINISIQRQQNKEIKIIVRDDGVGICEEQQKKILSNKNGSIGFSNVFKKLKLIKKSKFLLDSKEGYGTTITIILSEVRSD
ncbi:two-component system signal transduction histidine kinase [Gottschalkia acidurici 9a]|uniref:histidine kinase n=1 Tax=Gottschalkia acidurici (strain ATCC 7906 / DSM 604 / BCRC 14475 / CIP 104303 / KCTC 5404 / NCIMB 10678 / 9a) TaxID=1128398 RepID=K0B1W3_GOTA9|nr:ATP-binding protein [Gottschalkia acidurici]AFS79107.1 two-component system signal transduction histidine kinase [Gottschalkia acidurici 9a]